MSYCSSSSHPNSVYGKKKETVAVPIKTADVHSVIPPFHGKAIVRAALFATEQYGEISSHHTNSRDSTTDFLRLHLRASQYQRVIVPNWVIMVMIRFPLEVMIAASPERNAEMLYACYFIIQVAPKNKNLRHRAGLGR